MPIIKSAIKRVRQQAKRRSHNLQVKRAIHQDIRALDEAVSSGDAKATTEAVQAAISEIDRAVKKGTLHRNTADRRKSRLQKQANSVTATKEKPVKAKKAPAKKPATKTKSTAK